MLLSSGIALRSPSKFLDFIIYFCKANINISDASSTSFFKLGDVYVEVILVCWVTNIYFEQM